MFLATHGILARAASGGGVDPDAQAFITAAAITDPTQQTAINQLVVDLKGYSIWSKMEALYPMVGGTSTAHKFNLKNPLDTDAAFRLVFSGGWTHSSTGATPNGVNAFADTKLNASISLTTPSHLSFYTRTNGNTNFDQVDIGVTNFWLSLWYKASGFNNMLGRNQSSTVLLDGGVVTDSRGFGVITKIGTTSKLFKNNIQKDSKTDTTSTYSNNPFYLGALSQGGALLHSNRESSFASIGDGLTDTEAANFYTAVQSFQVALSRNI
jgi:hypothetical protein